MSPSSNRRWCPTPEQLMVLEELYRRGLRTPNAPQIQKITAHLSLYGNIQGKSVFYWFQNHKARDRQKLRNKHLLGLHFPFHFQGSSGMMRQTWRSPPDPPKDWLMRSYGHDSVMIMEKWPNPNPPCWRSQPLQTLELFPLSSPTAANDQERPAS